MTERGHWVWIDPDRIHQVLDNLISNAEKYGRPGTEIRIECLDRGELLEVVVTNHGPGIPADELPQLFSRFGRTRDARADRTPGIGLGLYIARGLVEAHGGHIWAESVPGATTSFHFTVPTASSHGDLQPGADQHLPA
jgi:signal transduction histidine kinase